MAQHFLNSSKVRDLSLEEITMLSETEAHHYFANIRWGCSGNQICPSCGLVANHYWRAQRKHWRCRTKGCEREFSVTQGTAFQDRKMPIKKILIAIFLYSTHWKGYAAHEMARMIDVTHRTAWLLLFKIRELFYKNRDNSIFTGTTHVDGAYFCGKRRDANKRRIATQDKVKGIQSAVYATHGAAPSGRQRRAKHLMPGGKANAKRKLKRRVVLVIRELSGDVGKGAIRTRVTIARREHENDVIPFIKSHVQAGTTIMSDENAAYNQLSSLYTHKTVQHAVEYQTEDGTSNNQAESFNSRMRRAEYGIYHGFRPTYLMIYACETAWQEDNRRKTLRERFMLIFDLLAKSGLSDIFRGYLQGNRLQEEILNK